MKAEGRRQKAKSRKQKAESRKQKAKMDKDLKDRTREYALRVIRLCAALPRHRAADIIARQLIKAGTSPGAHFREALRARSKAEYVAKMNGGLMELEEALYWLEIVEGAELLSTRKLSAISQETRELIAIFISLINKWKAKSRKQKAESRNGWR